MQQDRTPSAGSRLRSSMLPPLVLTLTACAGPLQLLPPAEVAKPAAVTVSESQASQDFSAKARAWLKKASTLLGDLARD